MRLINTAANYLQDHGRFDMHIAQYRNGKIETFTIAMKLKNGEIYAKCEGGGLSKAIQIPINEWDDSDLQNMLDEFGLEIRFCEECGKPYDAGFMMCDGDWYCCESCFKEAMNKNYGEGKWRSTDEPGEWDGYYEALGDDGEWEDTGIFYTEWN